MDGNVIIKQEYYVGYESIIDASSNHEVTPKIKVEPVDGNIDEKVLETVDDNTDAYTDSSDDENSAGNGDNHRNGPDKKGDYCSDEVNVVGKTQVVGKDTVKEIKNYNAEDIYDDDSGESLYSSDDDNVVYEESTDPFDSDESPDILKKTQNDFKIKKSNIENDDDNHDEKEQQTVVFNAHVSERQKSFSGKKDAKCASSECNITPVNDTITDLSDCNGCFSVNGIKTNLSYVADNTIKVVRRDLLLDDNDDADNEISDKEIPDEESKDKIDKSPIKMNFIHSMKRNIFLSPYKFNKKKNDGTTTDSDRSDSMPITGVGPYKCTICSERYRSRARLKEHFLRHSGKSMPHYCQTCAKGFSSLAEYKHHIQQKSCSTDSESSENEKLVKVKESREISNLNLPIDSNHKDTDTAEVCLESSNRDVCRNSLKGEKQKPESSVTYQPDTLKFSCDVCSKDFRVKKSLRIHYKTKHAQNVFSCEVCHKKFYLQVNLHKHLQKCHSQSRRNVFKCSLCKKEFELRKTLKQHFNKCREAMAPYKCDTCDKQFFAEYNLQQHIQTHSAQIDEAEESQDNGSSKVKTCLLDTLDKRSKNDTCFKCSICYKVFQSKRSLERHANAEHIDNDANKCEICGELFVTDSDLKQHTSVHHSFKCEKCTKVYKTKSAMEKHVRIQHSVNAPYTCTVCEKGFFAKYNFLQHLQEHKEDNEGEKSNNSRYHTCEICNNEFETRRLLTEHYQSHSEDHSYTCEMCDKKFPSKDTLECHLKTHVEKKTKDENKKEDGDLYKCKFCKKEFNSKKSKSMHLRTQHPNECSFRCEKCKRGYHKEKNYQYHMMTHESENQERNEKRSNFETDGIKTGLMSTEIDNSEMKYLRNSFIVGKDNSDKTPSNIFNKKTVAKDTFYECDKCVRKFQSKTRMEKHYRIKHTPNAPYTCSMCNKGFFAQHNLQKHMQMHKDSQTEKELDKCDNCQKEFSSGSSLAEHLCSLVKDGKFKDVQIKKEYFAKLQGDHITGNNCCSVQIESFGKKDPEQVFSNFRQYESTSEQTLFITEQNKTVANPTDSFTKGNDEHEQNNDENTNVDCFKCKICKREFKTKKKMSTHFRKRHADSTDFQCKICDKGFLRKVNYLNHLKIHNQHYISDDGCEQIHCNDGREQMQCSDGREEMQCNDRSEQMQCNNGFEQRQCNDGCQQMQCSDGFAQLQSNDGCEQMQCNDRSEQRQCNDRSEQMQCNDGFEQMQCNDGFEPMQCNDRSEQMQCNDRSEQMQFNDGHEQLQCNDGFEQMQCNDGCEQMRYFDGNEQMKFFDESEQNECNISSEKCEQEESQVKDENIIDNNNLAKDVENVEQTNIYQCNICNNKFTGKKPLKDHFRRQHADQMPFQCKICQKGFSIKRNLDKHYESHDRVEDLKEQSESNEKCIASHKNKSKVKICRGSLKESEEKEKEVEVLYDKEDTENLSSIKTEENSEHQRDSKESIDSFSMLENERTHKQSTEISHRKSVKRQFFQCTICPKKFWKEETQKKHLKRHVSKKAPFLCRVCGYSFFNESHFEIHVYGHESVEPDNSPVKMIKCGKCGKSFKHTTALIKHSKTHALSKQFDCNVCGREFWMERTLKQHVCSDATMKEIQDAKSNQDLNVIEKCSDEIKFDKSERTKLCSEGVKMKVEHRSDQSQSGRDVLSEQFKANSGEIQTINVKPDDNGNKELLDTSNNWIKCNICDAQFCKQSELENHEETHKQSRQNIFSLFNEQLSDTLGSSEKIRDPTFECAICNIRFIYKQNLDNHLLMHNEKIHSCNICQKKFKHYFVMQRHMFKRHSNDTCTDQQNEKLNYLKRSPDQIYMKKISLKKSFKDKSSQQKDKSSQQKDKSSQQKDKSSPQQKDKSSPQQKDKSSPQQKDKGSPPQKDKSSSQKKDKGSPPQKDKCSSQQHTVPPQKIHQTKFSPNKISEVNSFKSIEKPFICNFCENGFRTNEELDSHIHIHTKEAPYKCGFCGKAFKNMNNMLKHMKHHEDEKKPEEFKCSICNKTIASFKKLKQHMRNCHSHKGICKCDICGKEFTTKSSLSRHSLLHLNRKPFDCKICGDSFNRKDNWKKHQMRHTEKQVDSNNVDERGIDCMKEI